MNARIFILAAWRRGERKRARLDRRETFAAERRLIRFDRFMLALCDASTSETLYQRGLRLGREAAARARRVLH